MRKVLVSVVLLGASLGLVPAQAHCTSDFAGGDTDVILLTGTGLIVAPGFVGCIADDATTGGGHGPGNDTRFVVPGAVSALARWVPDPISVPGAGTLSGPVGAVDITDCDTASAVVGDPGAANSCTLTWTGVDLDPVPDGIFDIYESQVMGLNRLTTFTGGSLTVTAGVQSSTYTTVA